MSQSEINRFVSDLKANAALRAEAEEYIAEKHHETPIACAVAFAASKGYTFTADQVNERAKAQAKATAKLSDEALDGVAGGSNPPPFDLIHDGLRYTLEQFHLHDPA